MPTSHASPSSSNAPRRIIRAELSGDDGASAAAIMVVAYSPITALCRRLIAAGYYPRSRLEAWRGPVLCLRVRSIGEAAALVTEDSKIGQPRLRRWRAPQGVGQPRTFDNPETEHAGRVGGSIVQEAQPMTGI
jgi:hypothetical protein